jgi:hypothetical protein
MCKFTKFFVSVFVLLLFVSSAYTQTEIRPGTGINDITTAIEGASAGDIILLERGQFYFTNEIIDVNVNLTIMADEATSGENPVISGLIKEDGTSAQSIMEVRADIVIKNVFFAGGISGRAGGKDVDRAITFLDTEGMRAEFDGVWFDDFDRRTVQLEAPNMKFYARNCIWTDDHKIEGPSEGRAIDLRQYGPDTLVVQNCSFVNVGNRWIRHVTASGEPIGYAFIDHNSFVNGVNYHPAFDMGQIEKLTFTNNIIMDPGILGSDFVIRPSKNDGKFEIGLPENYYSSDLTLAAHRTREVYYDREDGIVVFGCHGVDTVGTEITMHHNFVNMDQSIIDKLATNDTLHVQKWMCQQFERSIVGGAENAFTISDVVFTDAPPLNFGDVDSYISYWDQNPDTRMSHTAPDSIDLTFSTSSAAYTAAEGGFPLGDLNWFPDKKAEWENWLTSVEDVTTLVPEAFELKQNYPNPFNPVTNISLSVPVKGEYTLIVYNLLGQEIATLISGQLTAGSHDVTFDASNLNSGIYFYALLGDKVSMSRKMVLIK